MTDTIVAEETSTEAEAETWVFAQAPQAPKVVSKALYEEYSDYLTGSVAPRHQTPSRSTLAYTVRWNRWRERSSDAATSLLELDGDPSNQLAELDAEILVAEGRWSA